MRTRLVLAALLAIAFAGCDGRLSEDASDGGASLNRFELVGIMPPSYSSGCISLYYVSPSRGGVAKTSLCRSPRYVLDGRDVSVDELLAWDKQRGRAAYEVYYVPASYGLIEKVVFTSL